MVEPYSIVGRAVLGGLIGGMAVGSLIQFVLGRMPAIGALYTVGDPNVTVGWIAHVGHSALVGMVYSFLSAPDRLRPRPPRFTNGVLAAMADGFALWFVTIGFPWPLWLN